MPHPSLVRTCPDCNGAGNNGHDNICFLCDGQGGVVPYRTDRYERFTAHIAEAFREFGELEDPNVLPSNAITLWREMVRGMERVSHRLTAPPKK